MSKLNQRKIHQILGLFLLLPLLGWTLTGAIFLVKPGYDGAYEKLPIQTYALDVKTNIEQQNDWEELRVIRTVLGLHYLVKIDGVVKNYNPETLFPSRLPTRLEVESIIKDSIKVNPERYGKLEKIDGLKAYTDTGVIITLNWDTLKLSQHGNDRKLIETLYKIHYLQWTKWDNLNLIFGIAGLISLAVLSIVGFNIYRQRGRKDNGHA